jgi:hypothetical protein
MNRFHGIFSGLLLFSAIVIAAAVLFIQSWILGLSYTVLVILSFVTISYFYCSKCCCRDKKCAHVYLGKLTKLLPERKQARYSTLDFSFTFLALITILFFPQCWLFKDLTLFFLYWGFSVMAFIEIFFFVCTGCGNELCPFKR